MAKVTQLHHKKKWSFSWFRTIIVILMLAIGVVALDAHNTAVLALRRAHEFNLELQDSSYDAKERNRMELFMVVAEIRDVQQKIEIADAQNIGLHIATAKWIKATTRILEQIDKRVKRIENVSKEN